jgi:pimeloyl-ACP methyl ester carboxylesterase
VSLASLTQIEAPAAELLHECGEREPYRAFRQMTEAYFKNFADGNAEAIAAMIDFYGGAGTFASWPERVRGYAMETTPVNIRDWASAYAFPLSAAALATIDLPVCVVRGGASHPAVQRANALIGAHISQAKLTTIEGAAHFMISTHAAAVAAVIAGHICAEAGSQQGAVPANRRTA